MKIEDTSRIVIKIGSSLLFDEETNKLNFDWLISLAEDVKYLKNLNKHMLAYMRKTSSVAGLSIWAKKKWRKIWPKNCLKWPKMA